MIDPKESQRVQLWSPTNFQVQKMQDSVDPAQE